ncbi:MAG: HD-GYP domain-containing protein [Desulfovibrio sp.]|uniref:HD-GYP domain-containing protein n=1 Tax=Desulfovibrio sp. 7SRBS1 TaxID=3378064 RepID=UPI003B418755
MRRNTAAVGREDKDPLYFPVSPLMLFPNTRAEFRVYLHQGERFVLYTRERQALTPQLCQTLVELDVNTVYVLSHQKEQYDEYVEQNLGRILEDEELSLPKRAHLFYDASKTILQEVFEARMPDRLSDKLFDRVLSFVKNSVRFLSREESLKSLGRLISHDYHTFSHSVNVYAYFIGLLSAMKVEQKSVISYGLGAMLHDVGKTKVRRFILDKSAPLTPEEKEEYRLHPLHGVAICSRLPLPRESTNCILFHHEQYDGSGYPTGTRGDDLPEPIRALHICNSYDGLTSSRPGKKIAMTPFEALSAMRSEIGSAYDPDIFKVFVLLLSGAEIV